MTAQLDRKVLHNVTDMSWSNLAFGLQDSFNYPPPVQLRVGRESPQTTFKQRVIESLNKGKILSYLVL